MPRYPESSTDRHPSRLREPTSSRMANAAIDLAKKNRRASLGELLRKMPKIPIPPRPIDDRDR